MNKVYILRGLPGSGKSSYRKQLGLPYVSKDEIRLANPSWSERQVHAHLMLQLDFIMRGNTDCIVDNTNLNDSTVAQYVKLAADYGYLVHYVDMRSVPIDTCILNDLQRKGTVGYVGSDVIITMALENGLMKYNYPDTYIFDIDGTLANTQHRTHLLPNNGGSWQQFFEAQSNDPLIEPVGYLLKTLAEKHTIICVSGRPDTYREMTREWLALHNLPVELLLMRRKTDKRPDNEVKRDIYTKTIKPYFNVKMIFDDRDMVVKMWREIGLVCAQMNYGDF